MCAARKRVSLARATLVVLVAVSLSIAGGAAPAAAELGGWVSGTVRAGGVPVANAWVTVTPVTPTGDWAGRPVQSTTDRSGVYQVRDLSASHVKIHVRAPSFSGLASTYWPDDYSFASAGTLRVASSGSSADVDLPVSASIRGRVVDADTGDPIVGALVVAHVDAPPGWEPVGSAGLAPGPGEFVIDGLPPVPITLQARARQGSNHLGQWYDGVGFFGAADPVAPGTSGIVIRLREGGEVSGVVRDDQGVAVPGAAVTIIGCPALCPMVAMTDDSGAYRMTAVPPGPGLRAYADAAAAGLLREWYTAPGQAVDTSFDLVAGEVRSDLDFALTAGAVAVGRVLDGQTGEPIPGVSVELVDVDNPLNSYVSRTIEDSSAALADPTQASPAGGPSAVPSRVGSGSTPSRREQASGVVIGPVPPAVYSLIVYPGAENGDYIPVELMGSSGLDGPGLIDLAHGERGEFTVSLVRQRMPVAPSPDAAGAATDGAAPGSPRAGQPEPGSSAGWPGLLGGFLSSEDAGFLRLGA